MDKADEWSCYIGTLCDAESLTERQRLPVADVPNAIMYFIELEVNTSQKEHTGCHIAVTRLYRSTLPAGKNTQFFLPMRRARLSHLHCDIE
jgi:hypothetical protein